MAKTVHYAKHMRKELYAWACYPVHGCWFRLNWSGMKATRIKSKVTCGNCIRTKAWKESK